MDTYDPYDVTLDRYGFYNTYVDNPFVKENVFLGMPATTRQLPAFDDARSMLPDPIWGTHTPVIDCYWKAWQLAFGNLRNPTAENGFVAPYIDTAFNNCLFMWDSAFILLFARYGCRVFDFHRTLDNLYAKQHPDGFICREIHESNGRDGFSRFDPAATGPNIMAWTEWEYFLASGSTERLARVFPVLVAFYQWYRTYRTWPDGSYWACGWSSGMDNQPRMPEDCSQQYCSPEFNTGHLAWIDTCLQQIFTARILLKMADVLGRQKDVAGLQAEVSYLTGYANDQMWDDESKFYYDRLPDGKLSAVKTIGAFWALIAEVVPPARLEEFIDHLTNPAEFNRPHRVPSLSAAQPGYSRDGDYWRGGVWAPTNCMVITGLHRMGYTAIAHEIAFNHLNNVVKVFEQTGTVWENYAPEYPGPGKPAKPNFVGWTGLTPVAILFEYVFGIKPDAHNSIVTWDVRLLEEHGISRYPLGKTGMLDLKCARRTSVTEKPVITASSNIAVELRVQWEGGTETMKLSGSQ